MIRRIMSHTSKTQKLLETAQIKNLAKNINKNENRKEGHCNEMQEKK